MEKIKAREAFEKGLTRYFTGKPCVKGHISERMISNGSCVECLKRKRAYDRTKEWRKNNPSARTEEARKYRKKHPDKVRETALRYRQRHIEKVRERGKLCQRRLRALNPEKEKARLKKWADKQENLRLELAGRPKPKVCEICDTNEFRIVFDHCHDKGHFRGWICDRCNRVLGCVKDSIEILRKMTQYLEKQNGFENT